jgi:PIN domain nuclease of toxin-antitoxin system
VKLLLDTCTFLWAITDAPALSSRARELIAAPGNEVFLSSVSAWEIAVKWNRGRLSLAEAPDRFVPSRREAHGMEALPFDEVSALHVTRLPALHHDPFDRMLVSQALVHGLVILTPDELITRYPARSIW